MEVDFLIILAISLTNVTRIPKLLSKGDIIYLLFYDSFLIIMYNDGIIECCAHYPWYL